MAISVNMLRLRLTIEAQPFRSSGPAGPEHDGRGEGELQQSAGRVTDPRQQIHAEMRRHGEHEDRQRQCGGDPEAAREIDEFMVRSGIGGRQAHGFERHAADRTVAGPVPDDLGMHRAGPLRAGGGGIAEGTRCACEESRRIGLELRRAMARAEIESLPLVFAHVLCRGAVDGHAADGIDRRQIGGGIGHEFVPAFRIAEMEGVAGVLVARLAGVWIDRHAADGIADHGRGPGMRAVVMTVILHGALHTPRGYMLTDIPP